MRGWFSIVDEVKQHNVIRIQLQSAFNKKLYLLVCIMITSAQIDDFIDLAKSDAIAAIRAQNTQDAIDADAIGAPAYVVDGEVFWGQDRIEYVDRMLETGRAAYSSEV